VEKQQKNILRSDMNIATLFSGIGSPEQGAKRVYENDMNLVFACEWDKFARESFNANYEIADEHFHKDINNMNGTPYRGKVDILIGGSPCQDFSIAGLRAGVDGQKGILIYQYIRIVKEVMPQIIIYENVKGMLSDKNGKTIKDFTQALRDIGYYCHYEVLNTKDYGVPQNRERVFLVGFLDHKMYYRFEFAPKIKLKKRLKDVLENEVDEKYYLNCELIENKNILKSDEPFLNCIALCEGKDFEQKRRIFDINGIAPTLLTDCHTIKIKADDKFKIRKLTPRECFRLQDFPDSFKFVVSNSQLYKQAGNSISVNVIEMIFRQIEKSRTISCMNRLF